MDVFKLLKQDHREVEKLFGKIEKSSDSAVKTREKTFKQVAQALRAHMSVEENIVYPRLREIKVLKDTTNEAYEEHHVAKQLIEELADMSADEEQWKAKASVLKEIIEHHVEEEEKELFPKAQKALGKAESAELGKLVEQEKKKLQRDARSASNGIVSQLGL